MELLETVIKEFKNLVQDVDNWYMKDFLKDGLVSHLKNITGLPESYLIDVVDIIYTSENDT